MKPAIWRSRKVRPSIDHVEDEATLEYMGRRTAEVEAKRRCLRDEVDRFWHPAYARGYATRMAELRLTEAIELYRAAIGAMLVDLQNDADDLMNRAFRLADRVVPGWWDEHEPAWSKARPDEIAEASIRVLERLRGSVPETSRR